MIIMITTMTMAMVHVHAAIVRPVIIEGKTYISLQMYKNF